MDLIPKWLKLVRIMDISDEWAKKTNDLYLNKPMILIYMFGKWLLEALGAKFRKINDVQQMLLRDVVYSRQPTGECHTYSIGIKAISERNKELPIISYDEEDLTDWIHQAMELALTQCHEIEYLFSKSFVFVVSEKQKKKYETLNDFFRGWKMKTLGGLITAMQEAFEIDDETRIALELFLNMRNQLIHGITISERYNISDNWGQRELINFLDLFLTLCILIKEIAASCFKFSIEFGNESLIENDDKIIPFKSSAEKIGLFIECFRLKDKLD